jgi:hypothetical protein
LTQYTKTVEKVPDCHQITKSPYTIPNGLRIPICTYLFHPKALLN